MISPILTFAFDFDLRRYITVRLAAGRCRLHYRNLC